MFHGLSKSKKLLYDPDYEFPRDENGEPYFVDHKRRIVYPKRKAGYHNIGGRMVKSDALTISRLGWPDPHTVIPRASADMLLNMSNRDFHAYQKDTGYWPELEEPEPLPKPKPKLQRKRTTEADRLGIWDGEQIIRGDDVEYLGSRTRRRNTSDRRSRSKSQSGGHRKR